MNDFRQLSPATMRRLPLYYRVFKDLALKQVDRIKSQELSDKMHIPAATIRHDFAALGELGRSGYGYSVSALSEYFGELLATSQAEALILVGAGPLGQAMLANNFRRNPDLEIVGAYDIDPGVIGQTIHGIVIEDFATIQADPRIRTAILTVPSDAQQAVVSRLETIGITAILTFAPKPAECKPETTIAYVDLTRELQTLLFVENHRRAN
ncbi:redox-sensing transcriptional repressor Rex [Lacticaseibacillus brantae]|uniref:Redox-sensing transcriptional repressor Rex n=1 Tax=Lacticaseibacillus brantae DSM 23927 TaxID=1423727 RepID=A0A0R2AZD0_9LACO|nr:redox-sensing transcriptional repressor Rex [Lacticaseibacillus brantae]KRM72487.1 redox-sensing transcriptional repressor Rex [Lacticaseibacillus brantae DSM 23927]